MGCGKIPSYRTLGTMPGILFALFLPCFFFAGHEPVAGPHRRVPHTPAPWMMANPTQEPKRDREVQGNPGGEKFPFPSLPNIDLRLESQSTPRNGCGPSCFVSRQVHCVWIITKCFSFCLCPASHEQFQIQQPEPRV